MSQEVLRGTRAPLDVIDQRHWKILERAETPGKIDAEVCGRCDQLWPCDTRNLLDVIKAIGRGESIP